jgi:(2Fe-2S) ferredoxin
MDVQALPYRRLIVVCTNIKEEGKAACGRRDSTFLFDALKAAVHERGLKGIVRVSRSGCLGQCEHGPNMMVYPDGTWHSHVTAEDLPALIARYLDGVASDEGTAGPPPAKEA